MSEWQPIETAPRDGTAILVFGPNGHGVLVVAFDEGIADETFIWGTLDGPAYPASAFTHWMPTPNPPKEPSRD